MHDDGEGCKSRSFPRTPDHFVFNQCSNNDRDCFRTLSRCILFFSSWVLHAGMDRHCGPSNISPHKPVFFVCSLALWILTVGTSFIILNVFLMRPLRVLTRAFSCLLICFRWYVGDYCHLVRQRTPHHCSSRRIMSNTNYRMQCSRTRQRVSPVIVRFWIQYALTSSSIGTFLCVLDRK